MDLLSNINNYTFLDGKKRRVFLNVKQKKVAQMTSCTTVTVGLLLVSSFIDGGWLRYWVAE